MHLSLWHFAQNQASALPKSSSDADFVQSSMHLRSSAESFVVGVGQVLILAMTLGIVNGVWTLLSPTRTGLAEYVESKTGLNFPGGGM